MVSRCQYIQGAEDAPIQGLDWVVASVSDKAYTDSKDGTEMGNVVIKTKEDRGYILLLGPGQLMRVSLPCILIHSD